ncbi:hypothetical protein LCGC14_2717960, partial [marine sediment metagenome]
KVNGRRFHRLCRGLDDRPVLPDRERKSLGKEITFEADVMDRRVVERTPMKVREGPGRKELKNSAIGSSTRTAITGTMIAPPTSRTVGWEPGCGCGADVMPCTVLDPFCGSGTTLVAARRLACHAVGIELNPEYARIAHDRIRKDISFQLRAAFPQKSRR